MYSVDLGTFFSVYNETNRFTKAETSPAILGTEYRNCALTASAMKPPRNAVSGMKRITATRSDLIESPRALSPPFAPPKNLMKKLPIELKNPLKPPAKPPPLLNHPNSRPAKITISSIADIHDPAAAAFRVAALSSTIM